MNRPAETDGFQRLLHSCAGTVIAGQASGEREVFDRSQLVFDPIEMPNVHELGTIEFLELMDVFPLPKDRASIRRQQAAQNAEEASFPTTVRTRDSQQSSWPDRHADVREQLSLPTTATQCDGLEHIRRSLIGTEEIKLQECRTPLGLAVRERVQSSFDTEIRYNCC